jgi:squalene monooxygenase
MHEMRILIDVPNDIYKASSKTGGIKGHIRINVIPALPKSVQPMVETALREGRLRPMPNAWLPPSMNRTAGVVLLGDAMNMRHPLTGSGMTAALNDVVLLRQLLSPQNVPSLSDTEAVLTQMRTFHWKRKEFNISLNILAQALYCLFVADGISHFPLSLSQSSAPNIYITRSSASSPSTRLCPLHPTRRELCRRTGRPNGWGYT